MDRPVSAPPAPNRRAFFERGALVLAAATTGRAWGAKPQPTVTAGLVTDMHFADKPAAGSRHYRDTPAKLAEAAEKFGAVELDFLLELGDFIDAADTVAVERKYLQRINRDFAQICPRRHYVLGNHCVHTLTKAEFLDGVEQPKSYYSFDRGGFHFIVLDACFRSDGEPYGRKNFEWTDPNLPPAEVEWLTADLAATRLKTIVFVHQRLDVANHYGVKNAAAVRKILEDSGQVLAVFQGHSHQNALSDLNGIHYCTLAAMVEGAGPDSNGYSLLSLASDGTIRINGFRRQTDYSWPPRP